MAFSWQCVDRGFGFDPGPPPRDEPPPDLSPPWGPPVAKQAGDSLRVPVPGAPPLPPQRPPVPAPPFKRVPPSAVARGYRPPEAALGPGSPQGPRARGGRVPMAFSQKLLMLLAFAALSLVAAAAVKWYLEAY